LRDAVDPVELIYYRGWWDLVNSPRPVAIVGTREASEEGVRRTKKLVRLLVSEGFTIVSGLAKGIDTAAHTAAIEAGGHTIAIIGTPLSRVYPKVNVELQRKIGDNFLLISQVPAIRYGKQDYRKNRMFFPERNKTMSALTDATVIVEAGETSGTLIQAQAAFDQKRKLFILDSCFQNPALSWPRRFEERGAIRVRDFDDILKALANGRKEPASAN
jgi:DNA processing protein